MWGRVRGGRVREVAVREKKVFQRSRCLEEGKNVHVFSARVGEIDHEEEKEEVEEEEGSGEGACEHVVVEMVTRALCLPCPTCEFLGQYV